MANDIDINNPFKDGDFNIVECSMQNINRTMVAHPGHFKMYPLHGVGISNYLNAPLSPSTISALERLIRLNLESDGAKNIKVNISNSGDINIKAVYE